MQNYVTHTSSIPGATDSRIIGMFSNQLYGTVGPAEVAPYSNTMFSFGVTGYTTTTATSVTVLPGTKTGSPWMPAWENTTSVYISDDSSVATFNVRRWSLVGATWTVSAVISWNSSAVYCISGRTEVGSGFVLYGTTVSGLFRYVATTNNSTLIAVPGAGSVFRGVAIAPISPSATSTATATSTSSPTSSTTGTSTATASITASNTATVTQTSSLTASSTLTASQTSSITASGSASLSSGASASYTATSTSSASATATASTTGTSTPTPSYTVTPRFQIWQPSNILVARVGDGTASCQGGCGVFFDEVVTSATMGIVGTTSSKFGPITASAGGRRCALTNSYPRDGWIQASADGTGISILCLDLPFTNSASGWPPSNTASTYKTLAFVTADGRVDTSTSGLNAFTGA